MYFDFVYGRVGREADNLSGASFQRKLASADTWDNTNRESARIRPSGEKNRICWPSLSQSSFAVLLIPHRERSGKSCRRPSASCERYSLSSPKYENVILLKNLEMRSRGKSPLGAAGAATGFVRTLPMRGEQVEGGLTRRGGLSRARLCLAWDLREWGEANPILGARRAGFAPIRGFIIISCFHTRPYTKSKYNHHNSCQDYWCRLRALFEG